MSGRTDMPDLHQFVGQSVVLDTQGSLIYIGRLEAYDERGYWLAEADVHDCKDSHTTKEKYVNDSHLLEKSGVRQTNRRRVFVERIAIVSISALADVIAEGEHNDPAVWIK